MPSTSNDTIEVLKRVAPGTRLRDGFERIMQQKMGALIVLGAGPKVDPVCSGGFDLNDASFTVAKLAEVAKMDGAIVLSDAGDTILRANVHLIPDPSMPTDETGSRHRTAERTARQTGKPVVSISEDRAVATLFYGATKQELESPAVITDKINQSLSSLDRFRTRLDQAEERMTRLEVADAMTHQWVVTVLQRAELVLRLGSTVERLSLALGGERQLVQLQLADLTNGIEQLRALVIRDYVPRLSRRSTTAALDALLDVPTADLSHPSVIAAAIGFQLTDNARPRGLRLLSRVHQLPEPVQEAVAKHFADFRKLLYATTDELDEVAGVGRTRAIQIRGFLDRVIDSAGFWGPTEG